jgi:murein DD-endopeptidase MepM/ murein hydrolase activator NlpD
MKMTECIHSLLDHTKTNCLNDNKEFIENNDLVVDRNLENQLQYTFNWTKLDHTKTISGIAEIKFIIHNIDDLKISNFKTDSIENLTKLIINYMTLTFAKTNKKVERRILVIKTKRIEVNDDNFNSLLKEELESNCNYFKTTPTFLYLKHKDNVGYYHKHYSNYADK